MAKVRNPNTGPYVVSWTTFRMLKHQEEHQTWGMACYRMRQLLIEGHTDISVRFV
jgi:hypothetical protein